MFLFSNWCCWLLPGLWIPSHLFCYFITDLCCYSFCSARAALLFNLKRISAENSSDGFVPNDLSEIFRLNVNGRINLWRDVLVSEPGRPVPVLVPVSVFPAGDALWGIGGVWGGVWVLTGHLGSLWRTAYTFIWSWTRLILEWLRGGHGPRVGLYRDQVSHLLEGQSEKMVKVWVLRWD